MKREGKILPNNWRIEELLKFVLGEDAVSDPSYLSDVYLNLMECKIRSCYWEQVIKTLALIKG